jgi:stage V sporulation protein G
VNITEVKIFDINKDSLKAFASITIDDEFVVTGIAVREGKNGLFISMPSRKHGSEYKDICFPITKEAREQITQAVLSKFDRGGYFPEDDLP